MDPIDIGGGLVYRVNTLLVVSDDKKNVKRYKKVLTYCYIRRIVCIRSVGPGYIFRFYRGFYMAARKKMVFMLGLAYAGYRNGKRWWTSPDLARAYDSKGAARLAASLRAQGLPVSVR